MHQIYRGEATIEGYLGDYAQLGLAFLALGEATGEAAWHERARTLGDRLVERFSTPRGGLVMTADATNLLVPMHSMGDDVQPSGTSGTIELLLRLAERGGGARFREAAQRALAYYGATIARAPGHWASAVQALHSWRTAAQAKETMAGAGTRSALPRLAQSADRVRVSARARDGAGEDLVVVTLLVDEGFHVNANPASLDYLIPTSVAFEGITPARVRYPEAVSFAPSFSELAIDVYEGRQELVAVFEDGTLRPGERVTATVTVQACDDKVCLAPSRIPVTATTSR